ncbi:NAD(P)/FAD-dependent oxidoreductase [Chloroflexota bacterium]
MGNSAGGIAAAEAIRQMDNVGTITIVSDEPYPAYSRILIPKYLTAERDFAQTRLRPPDFYTENSVKLLLGREAVKLMLDSHTVQMENGERISFKKLLLAIGGVPIIPKMDGSDKEGVFNFIKLDDVKAIHKYLGGVKRAVVIGGGLIGTSATEALTKRGVKVTVVEMAGKMLGAILDEYASSVVGKTLSDAGIEIATGNTVASIAGEDRVKGVTLDDGTEIECQMVVIAIGVSPRIDLVKGTDIEVERGIVVNLNMKTSHPDVYACGDVAEVHDYVHGENRVIPIWPGAHFGGRIAGLNMAGCDTEYMGCTGMNTMGYFGLNVASGGIVNPPDDSYEVLVSKDYGNYQKLVIKDNVIVGMVFMGNIDKGGIILNMMKDGANICDVKNKLISEDACGLTYMLWKLRSRACKY